VMLKTLIVSLSGTSDKSKRWLVAGFSTTTKFSKSGEYIQPETTNNKNNIDIKYPR